MKAVAESKERRGWTDEWTGRQMLAVSGDYTLTGTGRERKIEPMNVQNIATCQISRS
jgi:hypothetical protein